MQIIDPKSLLTCMFTSRPEAMGLLSALVYLLAIVNFLPFAFKQDIAAATVGARDRNRIVEAGELENGRFLHRFPLEKVRVCRFHE
jgi:UDP-N-acetylglucosamine--dolichyl-phosphate N-acetylglucosaminephosphotransferase